jgi:hypothetical protein
MMQGYEPRQECMAATRARLKIQAEKQEEGPGVAKAAMR